MITLYHFSDVWEFDPSPYCLKTETYLRLAKIPFEKSASLAAFLKAPRKKLPYIVDDANVIADSELIIDYGGWTLQFGSHISRLSLAQFRSLYVSRVELPTLAAPNARQLPRRTSRGHEASRGCAIRPA